MMLKLRYLLWTAAIVTGVSMAVACAKEDPQEEEPADTYEATVTLSKKSLNIAADVTETVFKVTSDHQWTASASESWVVLNPSSGEGGKGTTIKVNIPENTERTSRSCEITITSGITVVTVPLTQAGAPEVLTPSDVEDYDRIYIPKEDRGTGYLSSEGNYYFGRSRQSEHFILFWAKDYEDLSPDESSGFFRVDTRKMLEFLEQCFQTYTEKLAFSDVGVGKSPLDKYKMIIYLTHERTWRAEGFGKDNMVGCFWVNPQAANDNFTIAHEIGHSFQYQVYCDQVYNGMPDNSQRAWRWSSGKGQGFWEQTSQWQATVMNPDQVLTDWQFTGTFPSNAHRHILHEDMRYGSYFIHHYWSDKRGWDTVGKVWRSVAAPDDALMAYKNLFGLSQEELNAELYDYAAHVVTWDFSISRDKADSYLNKIMWSRTVEDDEWRRVNPKSCPEATGFNIIRLTGWEAGTTVSISLEGLPNYSEDYLPCDEKNAGWTIGFVGLDGGGNTRYYSPSALASSHTGLTASLTWEIPSGCKKLWAVVSATPTEYYTHVWDEDNTNDNQWPYRIKFTGATPV